jgi:hypothetical protein
MYRNNNEAESAIYYARLVSDHPASERVEESKRRLTAMNVPVPSPNPVAVAQAQMQARPERGLLSRMFSVFSRRPDVSTDTSAASVSDGEAAEETEGGGTFTIDPAVVQPGAQPRP